MVELGRRNSCTDVGGDTPAAAAHSSADLRKGIENKWGENKRIQTVCSS